MRFMLFVAARARAAAVVSLIGSSGLPSAFSVPAAHADASKYAGEIRDLQLPVGRVVAGMIS